MKKLKNQCYKIFLKGTLQSIVPFAIFISIFYGCSSVQIYTDFDRSADFTKYKSYAWLQRADSVNNYWYDNQLIERNVKNYANQELSKRGYKIDVNTPDLLLEYHTTVKKEHYTVSNPIYSNQTYNYSPLYAPNGIYNNRSNGYNINRPYAYNNTPYIIGYNNQQVEYNEGTLIIDVIDRSKNQLIWRGWSVGTVTDEQDLESQLQKDIQKIFLKYPIQPPKSK